MRVPFARWAAILFVLPFFASAPARAKDLGWQPAKTWVFAVGALNWKHAEMFGSFPVKNRRDAALVELFKQSGVPETQIVYLQDKQATQERIEAAFTAELRRMGTDDLLIVYYCGHGSKSEDDNDVYLASYDAGDEGVSGWSVNSIPEKIRSESKCARVLWLLDCCYSGQAAVALTKQKKGRPAYAAVTSSSASESSTEHWTFSDALLDSLRGVAYVDLDRDGSVTLAEFAAHLRADMSLAEEQLSTFATTQGFEPDLVLAQAAPLSHPKIGVRAEAQDADGGWYAGRIVEARGEKFKIHFIGYENDEDVWVTEDALRPIKPVQYAAGTEVEVRWKKKWYPATILQLKDGVHFIHYTGYEAKWDEWVPSKRVRHPKS